MKKLLVILILLPSIVLGQNFLGESKQKTKKHFQKWMNSEIEWIFSDSTIFCCWESEGAKGFQFDTVSVWTAQHKDCWSFSYYFGLTMWEDCDSVYIKANCEKCGIDILNGILDNSIYTFSKWRMVDDSTYLQPHNIGIDGGSYRTPKMTINKEGDSIVSISVWLAYLSEEEFKGIKKLNKIKTLPNN